MSKPDPRIAALVKVMEEVRIDRTHRMFDKKTRFKNVTMRQEAVKLLAALDALAKAEKKP